MSHQTINSKVRVFSIKLVNLIIIMSITSGMLVPALNTANAEVPNSTPIETATPSSISEITEDPEPTETPTPSIEPTITEVSEPITTPIPNVTEEPELTATPSPTPGITEEPEQTEIPTPTITETPSGNHTIAVCFVTIDMNNTVLRPEQVPGNSSFSINLYEDPTPSYPDHPNDYGPITKTVHYDLSNGLNSDKVLDDGVNDAYCQEYSFSNPVKHGYAYSYASIQSDIPWEISLYNDQNNMTVNSFSDFLFYSDHLFDDNPDNDQSRNTNADGHIVMNSSKSKRTLLILNRVNQNVVDVRDTHPVEVCFVNSDENGNILNSSNNIPPGNFSLNLFDDSYPQAPDLPTDIGLNNIPISYSTNKELDRNFFGDDDLNDTTCTRIDFRNHNPHNYTYSEVSINSDIEWNTFYNDSNTSLNSIDDFSEYDNSLFNAVIPDPDPESPSDGLSVSSLGNQSQRIFVLNKVAETWDENHSPEFSKIPSQTKYTGEYFDSFDLDDYASDEDGDLLTFNFSNNSELDIQINSDNVVEISNVENWYGETSISFVVTDDKNKSDEIEVWFKRFDIEVDELPPEGAITFVLDDEVVEYSNNTKDLKIKYSAWDVAQAGIDPSNIKSARFSNDSYNWTTFDDLETTNDCIEGVDICNKWDGSDFEVPFESTLGYTNGIDEGKYNKYMELVDNDGNISIIDGSLIFDITPPEELSGVILIGHEEYDSFNPEFTGSSQNYITYLVKDSKNPHTTPDRTLGNSFIAGVDSIRLSKDGVSFGPWLDYENGVVVSTLQDWSNEIHETCADINTGDCILSIYLEVRDKAGNISVNPYSDSIKYLESKPIVGFKINNNEQYTKSSVVALKIDGVEDNDMSIDSIRFQHCDGECLSTNWSEWKEYSSSYIDSLSSGNESGLKSICIQVRDEAGGLSDIVCDDIVLDKESPMGSLRINNGDTVTTNIEVLLTINADDPDHDDGTSGVGNISYSISETGSNWSEWTSLNSSNYVLDFTLSDISGETSVFVRYKDSLGNTSHVYEEVILLNTTTQSIGGNILINENDIFTHSEVVTLTISSDDDPTEMKIWNEGQDISTVETELFQTTKHWNLNNPEVFEVKKIFIQFLDSEGIESDVAFDEIILAPKYSVEYSEIANSKTEEPFPTEVLASDEFELILDVKNTGSETWKPQNTENFTNIDPVNISYHWLICPLENIELGGCEEDEYIDYQYEGNRGLLNKTVGFNQTDEDVQLVVNTPVYPGTYQLKIDAIHEGHTWFSDYGNDTPTFDFTILENPEYPTPEECDPEVEECGDVLGEYDGEFGIGAFLDTYHMASLIYGGGTINIMQGETSSTIRTVYKSVGYRHYDDNDIYLSTTEPNLRLSDFSNNTWENSVVPVLEASNYGSTVKHQMSFTFSAKETKEPGLYTECFAPKLKSSLGVVLAVDSPVCWNINVIENPDLEPSNTITEDSLEGWDATLVSKSLTEGRFTEPQVVKVRAGNILNATVKYTNSGTAAWDTSKLFLKTYNPKLRESAFLSTWIDKVTPTDSDSTSQSIAPGSDVYFRFALKPSNNLEPGIYTECFVPVVDGIAWMADEPACFTFEIIDETPTSSDASICNLRAGDYWTTITAGGFFSVGYAAIDSNVFILGNDPTSKSRYGNTYEKAIIRTKDGLVGSVYKKYLCTGYTPPTVEDQVKARLVSQSHDGNLVMGSNTSVSVNLTYENIGSTGWNKYYTFLNTASPWKHSSEFRGIDWISDSNIGNYIENTNALPGAQINFNFEIKTKEDIQPGTYTECFVPIIEYYDSLDVDPVCFNIEVVDQEIPVGKIFCTEGTDVYDSPSGILVDHLPFESEVIILSEQDSWKQININGNEDRWIDSTCFEQTGTTQNTTDTSTNVSIEPPTGDTGVVISTIGLRVYEGAAINYPIITTLPFGTELKVLSKIITDEYESINNWYEIELDDGRTGWVPMGYINISEEYEPEIKVYYKPTSSDAHICDNIGYSTNVELKYSPSFGSRTLNYLQRYDSLNIIDTLGNWLLVTTINGRTGYVYKNYVCEGYSSRNAEETALEDGIQFEHPIQDPAEITALYGARETQFHGGVDYGVACNTAVHSSADGWVIEVSNEGVVLGNDSTAETPSSYVIIEHTNGYKTYYWHMNSVDVEVGRFVYKGEYIGDSGNTGYLRGNPDHPVDSQGCHLHFEIRDERGNQVDPLAIIEPELDEEIYTELTEKYFEGIDNPRIFDNSDFGFGKYTKTLMPNLPQTSEEMNQAMRDYEFEGYLLKGFEIIEETIYETNHDFMLSCNIWFLPLTSYGEGSTYGKGGGLILNPYSGKTYIIEEYLWDPYIRSNGPCTLGSPYSKVEGAGATIAHVQEYEIEDKGYLYFQNKERDNNSIYWYDTRNNKDKVAVPVWGEIARIFESKGGTNSNYGFPQNYMQTDLCPSGKQRFMGGYISACVKDAANFKDVTEVDTFYKYINNLVQDGIISGYPDNTFKPDAPVQRGHMAKFIVNGFYIEQDHSCGYFPDADPSDHELFDYVTTLKCKKIVGGFSDGEYHPERKLSRGEAAKMIVNALIFKHGDTIVEAQKGDNIFPDISNSKTKDYIQIISNIFVDGERVMKGYMNGNFGPDDEITRGQMAKVVDLARQWDPDIHTRKEREYITSIFGTKGYVETQENGQKLFSSRYGNITLDGAILKKYEEYGFEKLGYPKTKLTAQTKNLLNEFIGEEDWIGGIQSEAALIGIDNNLIGNSTKFHWYIPRGSVIDSAEIYSMDELKEIIEEYYMLEVIGNILFEENSKDWTEEELEWVLEVLSLVGREYYYKKSPIFKYNGIMGRFDIIEDYPLKKIVRQSVHDNNYGYYNLEERKLVLLDKSKADLIDIFNYEIRGSINSFKYSLLHELSHPFAVANFDKSKEIVELSWNTLAQTPTKKVDFRIDLGLKTYSINESSNICDFPTTYISNSIEELAESKVLSKLFPEHFEQWFNKSKLFDISMVKEMLDDYEDVVGICDPSDSYDNSKLETKFKLSTNEV